MSLSRRQWLRACAAVAVFPFAACQRHAAGLSKEKIMQKYPMKTYAIGRFLIDLPQVATGVSISQRMFGADIKWKPATEAQYHKIVSSRINGLKNPDPVVQLFVSEEAGVVPKSRIILFEQDRDKDGFIGYEAYRYAQEVNGYFLLSGSADREKVTTVSHWTNEVLKLLQPGIIDPAMTARGTCFDHAFIHGADADWGETVSIRASFDQIDIRFTTEVVERIDDGPPLLERTEATNGFSAARLLRKSKREAAGLHGAEFAFQDAPQEYSQYLLQWEYAGRSNAIAAPKMDVALAAQKTMSLSEAELLGLWDVILDSVRLRPGAI